jgi:hypothetical protein
VTEAEGLLDVAYTIIGSPMGTLLLAATAKGLVRMAFDVEDHDRVLEMLAKRISPRVLRAPRRPVPRPSKEQSCLLNRHPVPGRERDRRYPPSLAAAPGSPAAAALPAGIRWHPGRVGCQTRCRGSCGTTPLASAGAFDMLVVGDFLRSAWEVIARGTSGWMRDRGVITTSSR